MIDHHATEEGVNAPAICQPLVNQPTLLHNKIARTDEEDEKKTEQPNEDIVEEQPPCIVKNPEEVYLSQDENLLSHKEILKKRAMMPIQSMEGAGESEVDMGFKMSVHRRFAEEKKNPHRRKIDFNRKKWKEDLLKLRFLWRGKDGSRPAEMGSWIYFEISTDVLRDIPWRTRSWVEDLRSDDADAVVVRKYEKIEDSCNSMIPCSDEIDRLVHVEDFSSDSELKMKNGFRNSADVLKVEGSVKVPGLASKELRARKKITEVIRCVVKDSPVISPDSLRKITGMKIAEAVKKIRRASVDMLSVQTVRVQELLVIWNQDTNQRMAEKRLSILEQIECIRNVQAPGKCGPLVKSNQDTRLPVFCDEIKKPWRLSGNCRITGRGDEVMVNIVIKFHTEKQDDSMDIHFTSRRICFGTVRELKIPCGRALASGRILLSIAACLRLKNNMPCPPAEDADPKILCKREGEILIANMLMGVEWARQKNVLHDGRECVANVGDN
ncbi:unnamed protein product [Orchesella dallaii]|uniref:Uncharacterized protein n=1 Tax=Orchesella dallaii TaxID=48710 RepID=A0ABP1QXK0_9HEXA